MSIDGPFPVLAGLALLVAATGLLAVAWDGRRALGRTALLALVVLAVTGTAALQVNRITAIYPTWSALVGSAGDGAPARLPATPTPGSGRLVRVTVPGPASGLTMPMTFYLPAAYDTPAGRRLRFPVVMALHGYPGTPESWIRRLDIAGHLDREIAAGRMAPTVVLLPYHTPRRLLDTECTNLTGGPQAETYLTRDVRQWAVAHLRIRADQAGWGLIGYSAGGFCAMNLALKHPHLYAAAASLSGEPAPGIRIGDGSEHTTNNIAWRLTHQPPPPISLYLGWAADESRARLGSQQVARLASAPLTVTTAVVAHGGHSHATWRTLEGPALDWLSARLARPAAGADPQPSSGR